MEPETLHLVLPIGSLFVSQSIRILSVCGSLREKSYNAWLARASRELAPSSMTIVESPSIGAFPFYNADEQTKGFPAIVESFGAAIREADGVLIVSPEYNYSIPGVLKNAIDWLSRLPNQPFKDKAIALQSASTGMLGGVRAQHHLRQCFVFLESRVFNRPEVIVPGAKDKFDVESGRLTDGATSAAVAKQLEAFRDFVPGRA